MSSSSIPPHPNRPGRPLRAARFAACLYFLLCGLSIATWAPMIPYVKMNLGLNEATLGLVLFVFGAGAMLTMPLGGYFINRFGSRATMLSATVLFSVMLPLLALAPNVWTLSAVLAVFGMGVGTTDVSMNAQAVAVEKRYGRPIMSFFHGLFSAGGIVGALLISVLLSRGIALWACAATVALLMIAAALWQFRRLLPHADDDKVDGSPFALPRGPVLLVGALCFISFLAEGAVTDWSAVFLRDVRGMTPAKAGLGYALFSMTMTVGRLTGDAVAHRLGPVSTMRYGALLAAFGYFLSVGVPHAWATLLGMFLVGLGLANVVPMLFSATGRLKDPPPAISIPAITTMGYAGLLAGPALIGVIGQATHLSVALTGVGVSMVFVSACARVVRR